MGSPRERSAQRSIAREGGNEVPQVIRNGIESNTETATVMSYLQQQGRLSSAWAAPSAVTSGRAGDGSETGTGEIWASENSSGLMEADRRCTHIHSSLGRGMAKQSVLISQSKKRDIR